MPASDKYLVPEFNGVVIVENTIASYQNAVSDHFPDHFTGKFCFSEKDNVLYFIEEDGSYFNVASVLSTDTSIYQFGAVIAKMMQAFTAEHMDEKAHEVDVQSLKEQLKAAKEENYKLSRELKEKDAGLAKWDKDYDTLALGKKSHADTIRDLGNKNSTLGTEVKNLKVLLSKSEAHVESITDNRERDTESYEKGIVSLQNDIVGWEEKYKTLQHQFELVSQKPSGSVATETPHVASHVTFERMLICKLMDINLSELKNLTFTEDEDVRSNSNNVNPTLDR